MPAAPKGRRKPVVSDSSRSSPSESEQSDFNETVASGRAFGKEQPPPAHGQRRKARPSLALPQPKPALPKNAAGLLIRKSANAGRRLSALVGGAGAAGGGPLAEVEGASRESMEEMSLKFEEWMKMATDNKITVNNTWKFALIDYFADLTLLRNGPGDDSINFQKASCTLDGCVKIWTSRVDSVASETGKLLSGLTETGNGEGEDAEEAGDSEGDDGDEELGKKKRKTQRNTNTLAPSFASISTKKLDLEFSVDPLFKKTSADFDEGGAGGLLMNHLGIDGEGKLVFDAGDAGLDDDEDEDEVEAAEGDVDGVKAARAADTRVAIDALKAKFLPFLAANPDELLSRPISTTLKTFTFSSAAGPSVPGFDMSLLNLAAPSSSTPNGLNEQAGRADGDANPSHDQDYGGMGGQEDFFADDAGDDGGDSSGGFGGPSFLGGESNGADGGEDEHVSYDNGGFSMSSAGFGTYNPSLQPSGKDLILAMRGDEADDDEAAGMFGYFDRQLVAKNWAGPEHWKVRRAVVGGALFGATSDKKDGSPKTPRKIAPAFTIDFDDDTVPDYDELFSPGTQTGIILASHRKAATAPAGKKRKSKIKEDRERELAKERDKYLLPQDLHFSSQQLLRLFTKKLYTLRMRKQERARAEDLKGDGEVDEQFWAQAAADQANTMGENAEGMGDDGFGGQSPAPFGTQFFQDDDDQGGGFDGGIDPNASIGSIPPLDGLNGTEEENLWAGTQDLKRTRPDYVKYTKRAKRVDVKKLKDSIWKGLEIFAPPIEGEEDDDEPMTPPPEGEDAEPRVFSSVVDSLQKVYPSDKLSDLSTSYCFICLLHLCNERGLQIETARSPGEIKIAGIDDDVVEETKVGGGLATEPIVGQLGWLKISKDVNAKGHA